MTDYLDSLNIHPKVRSFFEPYYTNIGNNIFFHYEHDYEHAGPGLHRVPITESHWTAGEPKLAGHLIISSSALEAIVWLNMYHHRYQDSNELCFLSVGALPCPLHAAHIRSIIGRKQIHFLFSNDPTGDICTLKLASWIRNKPIKIHVQKDKYEVQFKHRIYLCRDLSLRALEKASGDRFFIRVHHSKMQK